MGPILHFDHIFQDLLALLKNVENEIKICENNLRDEQEKMNKYKVCEYFSEYKWNTPLKCMGKPPCFYVPNLEEVEGTYCFWVVHLSIHWSCMRYLKKHAW